MHEVGTRMPITTGLDQKRVSTLDETKHEDLLLLFSLPPRSRYPCIRPCGAAHCLNGLRRNARTDHLSMMDQVPHGDHHSPPTHKTAGSICTPSTVGYGPAALTRHPWGWPNIGSLPGAGNPSS